MSVDWERTNNLHRELENAQQEIAFRLHILSDKPFLAKGSVYGNEWNPISKADLKTQNKFRQWCVKTVGRLPYKRSKLVYDMMIAEAIR
jgi:hypothetical protein